MEHDGLQARSARPDDWEKLVAWIGSTKWDCRNAPLEARVFAGNCTRRALNTEVAKKPVLPSGVLPRGLSRTEAAEYVG